MPISLQHHLPFAAMLACAAVACSERPSPVAPIATALAANNGGAPQPVDPTPYTDPGLSAICGFPVQVTLEGRSKQLVLPGDRIIVTGANGSLTLTNLTSGRTERLVGGGTFQRTTLPNGNFEDVLTGRSVVAFDNSFAHPFANSLLFITGRYSLVIDPATGAIVEPFHGNGQIIDLCDLLASPN
jgi:hypothetical protein